MFGGEWGGGVDQHFGGLEIEKGKKIKEEKGGKNMKLFVCEPEPKTKATRKYSEIS